MNGIDAIIALCIITSAFGLILGVLNEQRNYSKEAIDSILAKGNSLKCASIIDSMFSNSAEEYQNKLNCNANGNLVNSTSGKKTKESAILTDANKNTFLEVKILEHYGG